MSLRTKLFRMLPWTGGINTAVNEAVIEPNELIRAENLVFDSRGSRRPREGINYNWDDETTGTDYIIGLHHFNYGTTSKTSKLVSLFNDKTFRSYSSGGTHTNLTDAGSAWSSSITKASFEVFNNLLIIAVDGSANVVKQWDGSSSIGDLTNAPQGSIVREHLGRLWMNDKTNIDRLHYSTTGDETEWNGSGDSGALDIGIGDGDPSGITAIFPTFKGDLFVAKKTKLYRVSGYTPETFNITLVSSGIGCVSHNSVVPVDQGDILFVSERGVHSLVATDAYGDFEATFLSSKIHQTFINKFSVTRLPYTWGGYIPELQSVLFAFSNTDVTGGGSYNNDIWLYNIQLKIWYNWINIPSESMIVVRDSDRVRPYFGGVTSRVAQGQTDALNDTNAAGSEVAISSAIETGILYPEDPFVVKGFKRIAVYHQPVDSYGFDVRVSIDNYPSQTLSFSGGVPGDQLDVDFTLGTSTLGGTLKLAPYALSVDGHGRSIQLLISMSSQDKFAEIQGFAIEYETHGTAQEVEED